MATEKPNLNLAREFGDRLTNVCYNHTTIQVITAMASVTNWEKMNVYAGLDFLRRYSHLSRPTLTRHLAILREDGLVKPEFSKGELLKKQFRQNYHLILPPHGIRLCSEWAEHARNKHHESSWRAPVERVSKTTDPVEPRDQIPPVMVLTNAYGEESRYGGFFDGYDNNNL